PWQRILLLGVQGGPAPTVREELPQAARDGRWHELIDISAEGGDLLHTARRDEAHLWARHDVDRLDVRGEHAVQLVHLELPLEVGDDAKALHDRPCIPTACEVHDELLEHVDLYVVYVGYSFLDERDPLVDREHRRLVLRRADDADDDAVEDARGAGDDVDVPVRHRVVGAGADGGDQFSNSVSRAEPYLRDVRTVRPSISGSVRAEVW